MDKDIIEDMDFYFYQVTLAKKRYYERCLYEISSKDSYRNYNKISKYVRRLNIYLRSLKDKLNEPEIL